MLVGAGRANLHLLSVLSRTLLRRLEVVLVAAHREVFDSAMTSALLRGAYAEEEMRIDVLALAARAGARVVSAVADAVVPGTHVVHAGGERIAFDLCVLDEIGLSEGGDLPGVPEHAISLRPVSRLGEVRRMLAHVLRESTGPVHCTVVGGGTSGVECAFAMQRMLRARAAGGVVTIVDGAPDVLGDMPACRDLARRALERAGVCFALGAPVVQVDADRVVLASGGSLPGDLVIWATGGAPTPLIATSDLPHDSRGRLLVDDRLRARDGAPIWAAGDCAAIRKDGVDAHSHGRLLEREILAHLGARTRQTGFRRWAPCMIDTGDGRAIVRWRTFTMWSPLGGWLKRRLDHQFVARLKKT